MVVLRWRLIVSSVVRFRKEERPARAAYWAFTGAAFLLSFGAIASGAITPATMLAFYAAMAWVWGWVTAVLLDLKTPALPRPSWNQQPPVDRPVTAPEMSRGGRVLKCGLRWTGVGAGSAVARPNLGRGEMHKTIEAIIEADGTVRLLEPVEPGAARRALLTILDEPGEEAAHEPALLAERALGDWGRDEEDEAWAHLQPDQ